MCSLSPGLPPTACDNEGVESRGESETERRWWLKTFERGDGSDGTTGPLGRLADHHGVHDGHAFIHQAAAGLEGRRLMVGEVRRGYGREGTGRSPS